MSRAHRAQQVPAPRPDRSLSRIGVGLHPKRRVVVAVRVIKLALVHERVVVSVTDPPAGGAGALDQLVDCFTAAKVERDRDLEGVPGPPISSSEPPTLAYISRLPSMTYCSGAIAKHDTLWSDISG